MRRLLIAALLAFLTIQASPNAERQSRTLLVLLAHADDETAAAPALARYAREGVKVHLVIATDGSGGSGSQTYLERPDSGPVGDALARARAEEARCAAAALGMQEPTLLAFPDGKLGDYLGDRTLMTRLTDQIARQIDQLRPDVVVTWGPDGGTGHPDHRIVSNIATQLLRYGASGMPERLFYMYMPAEFFRLANPQRGEPPLLLPQPKYFTIQVPFTPADLEASKKAAGCHKTQFTPETLGRLLPEVARIWNGRVPFVPADLAMKGQDLFR
ncbi:MAG TPA: PIG-L family deacetylase [Vicinamibacterales bacterium]|nr:PIG-L family deacetylase [Vicinamibacterales bacterium]